MASWILDSAAVARIDGHGFDGYQQLGACVHTLSMSASNGGPGSNVPQIIGSACTGCGRVRLGTLP
jgi:hypothetical protein